MSMTRHNDPFGRFLDRLFTVSFIVFAIGLVWEAGALIALDRPPFWVLAVTVFANLLCIATYFYMVIRAGNGWDIK